MEQKAVAEVGSICFSKVLPGKKWNVKLELNWQLKSPKLLHMISLQEESLVCCKTRPLPPLSSMHNLRYKNYFEK